MVVTYRPDEPLLAALLRRLQHEVDSAVVVDNGSPGLADETLRALFPDLRVDRYQANRGLAVAQNRGIALAKAAGASHVLFLDQDSIPQAGMTRILLNALHALQANGVQVACVGPRVKLLGSDEVACFRRLGWLGPRMASCSGDAPVECDFVISSGSLVPIQVLEEVGGMEEALFIDQVDTEWCFRARSKGYRVFGACGAVLDHRVGEGVRWIWLGRWRRLFRQKAFRYYYIFRNTLILCRRDYVELKFVPFHLAWLAAMLLAFGVFGGRSGGLRMMLKGIAHGLQGATGELKTATSRRFR